MIKHIFIYWYQGFKNSPYLVKKCLESWKFYNPTWEITEMDKNNLYEFLPDLDKFENYNISHAAYSDIIRINLLNRFGGLWVDATTFCNKSLDEWLDNYLVNGFFCFSNPGPDRLISSWFIYSSEDNYIIQKWLNKVNEFWIDKNRSTYEYFWVHYLFNGLYEGDEKFKSIWDYIPHLEANGIGPHYIQQVNINGDLTAEIKDNIDAKIIPLYKLTYRIEYIFNVNSTLYYLFNTI